MDIKILLTTFVFLQAIVFELKAKQDSKPIIEEVVVTASLLDREKSYIEKPIHIVNEADLQLDATASLGEKLNDLLGVSTSDYGAAVGQPIIRGLSGNRVKILTNGMVNRDVSSLGGDHSNDLDLNHVQQIEVVRGPSSLLYSNGTVGGIINVVDNSIARTDIVESSFDASLEGQSVNNGSVAGLAYRGQLSNYNVSLSLSNNNMDDFTVPKGAFAETKDDINAEQQDKLANSDWSKTSAKFGVSRVEKWGFIGFSHLNSTGLYGLPYHYEVVEEEEEKHQEERVYITTDSRINTLSGKWYFFGSAIEAIDFNLRDTDYQLIEYEDEDKSILTNDAQELNSIVEIKREGWLQKIALNYVREDLSIEGSEVFMRPTQSRELLLGYYASKNIAKTHIDFGLRYDQIGREGLAYSRDDTFYSNLTKTYNIASFSLGITQQIQSGLGLSLGLSSVGRSPSVSELFINGLHVATQRYEIGNSELKTENSYNVDLNMHYERNNFFLNTSVFFNDYQNYIYLEDEPIQQSQQLQGYYKQRDATLKGYEIQLGSKYSWGTKSLEWVVSRDLVTGEFAPGEFAPGEFAQNSNIPRIVPLRTMLQLSYAVASTAFKLKVKEVARQGRVADNETPTKGYTLVDLVAKLSLNSPKIEWDFVFFVKNLLDEVARNHTSFVKDEVPLAGRNFGIKVLASF